jgi:two-component system, chemotaxis family, chemotaxis protein CheY
MRALIIDDSRVARTVIRGVLREMGIEVSEAGDGREGFDALQTLPDVDLVLVDWNMPVMDGLEFITAVRAQRAYDDVKIVMVTTETESEQVSRAMNAGANEYVMKPFTKDVLVAKLSMLKIYGE